MNAPALYSEYLRHPVFRIMRAIAIEREPLRLCGKCHERPATEAHHEQYPVRGAFYTPGNLIGVCHECHCEEERVKRPGADIR